MLGSLFALTQPGVKFADTQVRLGSTLSDYRISPFLRKEGLIGGESFSEGRLPFERGAWPARKIIGHLDHAIDAVANLRVIRFGSLPGFLRFRGALFSALPLPGDPRAADDERREQRRQ